MKTKYILFFFVLLMCVNLVSSLDFDNVVRLNDIPGLYPEIEIKDNFGFGGVLWSGQLKQNTPRCSVDCAAETTIILNERGALIQDIKFITLPSNVEEPIQDYNIFISTGYTEQPTDILDLVCSAKGLDKNGSSNIVCDNEVTGTYQKKIHNWVNYNLDDDVDPGTYYIKIEGKKNPFKTVDWVIKTEGKWLDAWAVWGSTTIFDDFIDASIDTDLWNVSGSVTEFTGYLHLGASGGLVSYASLKPNFKYLEGNLTYIINLTTVDAGESALSLSICNKTDSLTWSDLGSPSGVCKPIYFDRFGEWTQSEVVIEILKDNITAYRDGLLNQTALRNTSQFLNDVFIVLAAHGDAGGVVNIDLFNVTSNLTGSILNFPEDNLPTDNNNVLFNCSGSAPPGDTLTNISLYHNLSGTFLLNDTNLVSGTNTTTLFNKNLVEGIGIWNCRAGYTSGDSEFSLFNRSMNIDISAPNITLGIEKVINRYSKDGDGLNFTWSIDEQNPDTCWFEYNNTNTTVVCTDNIFEFNITIQENLTFYVNDTLNQLSSKLIAWEYVLFQNSLSFNPVTSSGGIEDFSVNITYDAFNYSGILGILNYNGTNFTMSSSGTGQNINFDNQQLIPTVLSDANVTFSFFIGLTNSSGTFFHQSLINNQTINSFLVDDCSTFGNAIFNLSLIDEITLQPINGTIEIAINLFTIGTNNFIGSYNNSFSYDTGTNTTICFNNISTSYKMAYEIRYFGNDSYFKKYKIVQNFTLNNDTDLQNIVLYNLLQSLGETFKIIVVGNTFTIGNSGLLIDAQKQYLAQNKFISVENSETDASGEGVLHLITSSDIYNFIITSNGRILGVFNKNKVQCQNPTTLQCVITLNLALSSGSSSNFFNFGNVSVMYDLDTENSILFTTYVSVDSEVHEINQTVTMNDGFSNTTICSENSVGTSGTLICNIPVAYQNRSYFSNIFVDGEYKETRFFSLGQNLTDTKTFGVEIFIQLLLFSCLVMLLLQHPILIVLGAVFGMTLSVILIFITGASFGALMGVVIFYIIGGVIIVWQISKKL